MSVPATIAHAVQQAQEWLKQVRDYADLEDEQHAYSVLRAVLHQLRDRLTLEEAFNLSARCRSLSAASFSRVICLGACLKRSAPRRRSWTLFLPNYTRIASRRMLQCGQCLPRWRIAVTLAKSLTPSVNCLPT